MQYIVLCSICTLLFHLCIPFQSKKYMGYVALIPTFFFYSIAIFFYFTPFLDVTQSQRNHAQIGCVIYFVFWFVFLFWNIKKETTLNDVLFKIATILPILSLFITIQLSMSETKEMVLQMTCLSVILFATYALIICNRLLLCVTYGYSSILDAIRTLKNYIKSKKLLFVRIALLKDAFQIIGKSMVSIASLSFFMFVNALYSTGIGLARYFALKLQSQHGKQQIATYQKVGIVLMLSSLSYVVYSIRLFFGGKLIEFPMILAILIACITFGELFLDIKDVLHLRKSDALESKALRAISLSSTLLNFVLTQSALMSFASKGDNSHAVALAGIFFGGLATLVGLYVMFQARKLYALKNI